MSESTLERISREVSSWPGVSVGETGRDVGPQFSFGKVELGHLHGDRIADLPFPKKLRNELIEQGRASVHDPLPNSGWVRKRINGPEDVKTAIELFRMNYDRAKARAERRAKDGE